MGVNQSTTTNEVSFFTDESCKSSDSDISITKAKASLSQTTNCSQKYNNTDNVVFGGQIEVTKENAKTGEKTTVKGGCPAGQSHSAPMVDLCENTIKFQQQIEASTQHYSSSSCVQKSTQDMTQKATSKSGGGINFGTFNSSEAHNKTNSTLDMSSYQASYTYHATEASYLSTQETNQSKEFNNVHNVFNCMATHTGNSADVTQDISTQSLTYSTMDANKYNSQSAEQTAKASATGYDIFGAIAKMLLAAAALVLCVFCGFFIGGAMGFRTLLHSVTLPMIVMIVFLFEGIYAAFFWPYGKHVQGDGLWAISSGDNFSGELPAYVIGFLAAHTAFTFLALLAAYRFLFKKSNGRSKRKVTAKAK